MKRAVFLDRDGTLNAMVYNTEFGLIDSPANPDEFRLLPGAGQAVRMINELGLLAVVASNQPGIAKGKFSPRLLDAMTHKMLVGLGNDKGKIDTVYYCTHHPDGVIEEYRKICDCRKPKPGLLIKASDELDIDLHRSYMIGDGITDMQAGQAAGVTTILIYPSSKCYLCEELNSRQVNPNYIVRDIVAAVQVIKDLEKVKQ